MRAPALLLLLTIGALPGCGLSRYLRSDLLEPQQPSTPAFGETELRVVLVGDAGEARPGWGDGQARVIRQVRSLVEEAPQDTIVVWLGDNVYPSGYPSESDCDRQRVSWADVRRPPEGQTREWRDPLAVERNHARKALLAQLDATSGTAAEAIFLPGNHDWDHSGPCGLERVLAQQELLERESQSRQARLRYLPPGGCPGPVYVDRGPLRLVALNSEWLLMPDGSKRPERDCAWGPSEVPQQFDGDVLDRDRVYARLDDVLEDGADRIVVVAAHHPLYTRATHGGYHPPVDYLFPLRELNKAAWIPLPGIGALYPWLRRSLVKSDQDLVGPLNQEMRASMLEALGQRPPLFHVAGHDHALQVLAPESEGASPRTTFLVSGTGSKRGPVGKAPYTLYKSAELGFMVLDLERPSKNRPRRVRLSVVEVGSGDDCRVSFCALKDAASGAMTPCETTPECR